jgi:hypothetical protein
MVGNHHEVVVLQAQNCYKIVTNWMPWHLEIKTNGSNSATQFDCYQLLRSMKRKKAPNFCHITLILIVTAAKAIAAFNGTCSEC